MSVYFLRRASGGPIKIGYSWNPRVRAEALRTTYREPMDILGVLPGQRWHECELHRRFAHSVVSGEWFEETPELIVFIAQHAAASEEVGRVSWTRPRRAFGKAA